MKRYAKDYTIPELMAVFYSRQIQDGERAMTGTNTPIPRAGILLAHLMHGPNMRVAISLGFTNLVNMSMMPNFEFAGDWRGDRLSEWYMHHEEQFHNIRLQIGDLFVVGAIQIDMYGNSNLIGVGDDYRHLKFRGPGAIGTPTISTFIKRYYLHVNTHDERIFVPKCDFVSAFGWGTGGKDARKKLGIPGGGPMYCITPLCIFDFEEETKRMRLKSVHPGISVQQVITNTGFEFIIPSVVPETEPPTEEEIEVLRSRIDVGGILRLQ